MKIAWVLSLETLLVTAPFVSVESLGINTFDYSQHSGKEIADRLNANPGLVSNFIKSDWSILPGLDVLVECLQSNYSWLLERILNVSSLLPPMDLSGDPRNWLLGPEDVDYLFEQVIDPAGGSFITEYNQATRVFVNHTIWMLEGLGKELTDSVKARIRARSYNLLFWAAYHGDLEAFNSCMRTDERLGMKEAFLIAASHNQTSILSRISQDISFTDYPDALYQKSIWVAAMRGYRQTIEQIDPELTEKRDFTLKVAYALAKKEGHKDIADWIFEFSIDPNIGLEYVRTKESKLVGMSKWVFEQRAVNAFESSSEIDDLFPIICRYGSPSLLSDFLSTANTYFWYPDNRILLHGIPSANAVVLVRHFQAMKKLESSKVISAVISYLSPSNKGDAVELLIKIGLEKDSNFTVDMSMLRERPNDAVEIALTLASPIIKPSLLVAILPYNHPALKKFYRPLDGLSEEETAELSALYAIELETASYEDRFQYLKHLLYGNFPKILTSSLPLDMYVALFSSDRRPSNKTRVLTDKRPDLRRLLLLFAQKHLTANELADAVYRGLQSDMHPIESLYGMIHDLPEVLPKVSRPALDIALLERSSVTDFVPAYQRMNNAKKCLARLFGVHYVAPTEYNF